MAGCFPSKNLASSEVNWAVDQPFKGGTQSKAAIHTPFTLIFTIQPFLKHKKKKKTYTKAASNMPLLPDATVLVAALTMK